MTAVAVIRTELYKSTRRLRTYVAYAIVCLIPIIITVAIKANPPGPPGDGGFLLFLGSQSGLLIPAVALRFTSEFLLVIMVALFAGEAIAGEATWGNLRYLLMRPIPRGRLFTSKLIVATLCGWFAVLLVVIVGLIAGGIAFGLEPIGFFSTPTQIGSGSCSGRGYTPCPVSGGRCRPDQVTCSDSRIRSSRSSFSSNSES
jgi:ABC-type transport system involved in multi-copper enzyme maturation permease subunit